MTAYQVFRNTLVFVATLALAYIFFLSHQILIGLLIAILVASAVRPPTEWLKRRGIPQGLAILLVYGSIGLAGVLLFAVVLPPIVNQFVGYLQHEDRLANRIIYAQSAFVGIISQITGAEVEVGISPEEIRDAVSEIVNDIKFTAPSIIGDAGAFVGEFILMIVMGLYWSTSRDKGVAFLTDLVPPGRREQVKLIVDEIEFGLGGYVRGIVLVSVIVGTLSFAAFVLLRIPNAASLSFFYGVATAIPIVGGLIGVAIATLLALLISPLNALIVFIVTVLLQQVENYYLTPRIMGGNVDFDPILIIVFVSAGFATGGILGALLSIPLAGTVAILLKHLVLEPRRAKVTPTIVEGGVLLPSNHRKE